jgi:hypothetical protein
MFRFRTAPSRSAILGFADSSLALQDQSFATVSLTHGLPFGRFDATHRCVKRHPSLPIKIAPHL